MRPCLIKTRDYVLNITNVTVLIGISATENLRLNDLANAKKKNVKNGTITKQVCPAFFVASAIPL